MRGINLCKAGMEGLDANTIDRIIEDNSKGSKFYENEVRRGAVLKQQVERKLAKLHSLTKEEIDAGEKEADKLLRGYSTERRFDRCIVHIDMDAFYAAVEMRDNPSLRLQPLAVGSQSMLSTSNYLARRFGVRAAMPGFLGKKLCPQLTIVPPDFVKYTEVSRVVRSVLMEYCEDGPAGLVVMSLDEVPGIGYVTECRLKAFGVERIEDLRGRRGALFHLVSRIALAYYMRITLGHSEDDWADPAASATATGGDTDLRGACQRSIGIERCTTSLSVCFSFVFSFIHRP
ncbi:DNA polymerase kappa [Taenia solium]|eukprot:TsM_000041700 transcript=TsM_000041700 gene=TsM_000041700